MDLVRTLGPLALVVAAAGAVTWFALDRGVPYAEWLLAGLLLAHGSVHLMFAFPKPATVTATAHGPIWPFDMARSWLIGAGIDAARVRTLGLVLVAVTFVAFAVAAFASVGVLVLVAVTFVAFALAGLASVGIFVPSTWWSGLMIGAATSSILLLLVFFSPTLLLGLGIDLALLWYVLAVVWSPTLG
jgi:hypothetical protein